jgi:geranylgeranyl pyrophosphate synthase
MAKGNRFDYMRAVQKRIWGEFNTFMQADQYEPECRKYLFEFIEGRLQQIGIRSYFVFAVSQYVEAQIVMEGLPKSVLSNNEHLFGTQIPLVAEWAMAIAYLENQVLDGKHGTLNSDGTMNAAEVKRKLLASHYLKDKLYGYISEKVLTEHPKSQQLLSATVRRVFNMVDLAQVWDKTNASFEHYTGLHPLHKPLMPKAQDFIHRMLYTTNQEDVTLMDWLWNRLSDCKVRPEKRFFVESYFERIALENGYFFVAFSELICELLGYNSTKREELIKFVFQYALMCQVVNDNLDVLPMNTGGKRSADSGADTRNGIVTITLLIYFEHNQSETMKDLQYLLAESQELLFLCLKPTVRDYGYSLGIDIMDHALLSLDQNNEFEKSLRDLRTKAVSLAKYGFFSQK